jgi:enamine deaminase RidA (YjgF/YER057c/UK114 family)
MTRAVTPISPVRIPNTDIHYAPGIKAGNWVFLTGIEATDYACGLHPSVAGNPDLPYHGLPRHRREGDFICSRFKELLAQAGTSFANTVRLDQYYPTWKAVDPYHLARKAAFGNYIPPSTSVLMEELLTRGGDITASLLAVVPGDGRDTQRVPTPQVTAPQWSGFVPAVTSGDFVFIAGQMARGVDGNPDPRAHVASHSRWGGYEIRRQTEYLIGEKFVPALRAAGSSLGNALKAQVYLSSIDDTPHFLDVWNSHFGARQCALTIVPTAAFGLVPGVIEINLVAVTDRGQTKKQIIDGCIPAPMTYGAAGVRAGDLLMLSGMMAVDASGPIEALRNARGLPDFGGAARAQMEHIVRAIKSVCAAGGASIENVARIHQFHTDLGEFYSMHRAWQEALGDAPVPFTAVRVPAPQPVPACSVIVDAWIYAP